MRKRCTCQKVWMLYAAFLLVLTCAGAWSRASAEEHKLPCSEEISKYCGGVKPGGGRILGCLKEHEKDLTPACMEKFAATERRLEEAKQICAGDSEKFCKGIQPGEGRIAKCLKEHIQEISLNCREKVSGLKQLIPEKPSEQ